MLKKFVALICVAVMCFALVSEAMAATCEHTYIWEKTTTTRTLTVGSKFHQKHIMFVKLCNKCGQYNGYDYLPDPDAPTESHRSNGVYHGYHRGTTNYHVLYLVCSVCQGTYDYHDDVLCPGGDAHVTHP